MHSQWPGPAQPVAGQPAAAAQPLARPPVFGVTVQPLPAALTSSSPKQSRRQRRSRASDVRSVASVPVGQPGIRAAKARVSGSNWSPGHSSKAGSAAASSVMTRGTAQGDQSSDSDEEPDRWTGRHSLDYVVRWCAEQKASNPPGSIGRFEGWLSATAEAIRSRSHSTPPAPDRAGRPPAAVQDTTMRSVSAFGHDYRELKIIVAEIFADPYSDRVIEAALYDELGSDRESSCAECEGEEEEEEGERPQGAKRGNRRAGRPDKLTRERRRRAEERTAMSGRLVSLENPVCCVCGEAAARAKCWHRDCRTRFEVYCGRCGQRHKERFQPKHLPFLLFSEASSSDAVLMSSNPSATAGSGRTRKCRPPGPRRPDAHTDPSATTEA